MDFSTLSTMADDALKNIMNFINTLDTVYAAAILAFFAVLFMLLHFLKTRSNKSLKVLLKMSDDIMESIEPSKGLEKNLNNILDAISPLVSANSYAFYLLDQKSGNYVLKSVLQGTSSDNDRISPSYSGLFPASKEAYMPPISLTQQQGVSHVSLVRDGAVPLLMIPINGSGGLIRLGPVTRVPKKRLMKLLDRLCTELQPVLDILVELESMRNQVDVVVSSSKAVHSISNIMTDYTGILNTLLGTAVKTLEASGGAFVAGFDGTYEVPCTNGLDSKTSGMLKNDPGSLALFIELASGNDITMLRKGDSEFYRLPSYLAAAGIGTVYLINVGSESCSGVAVFWYDDRHDPAHMNEYLTSLMMGLAGKMAQILNNHSKFKELSHSYIDMLKLLSQAADSSNAYSTGYSELMSRYSAIIAKEMGLGRDKIREIALAAYLSNIGVLGLSEDLSNKVGRYTEREYELMKLHADIGASIIESTVANHNLAAYIRYHHERMDGFGYPSGLKGNDIPLGARILAVVQTFLAKINGRADRSPLTFERTIEILKSASGTQLDPTVVGALVSWFAKKQDSPQCQGRSLGPCWEMRCSPESICSVCPAYGNTSKNCWEFEHNNCSQHGNKCDSCFIRTEYLYRQRQAL